MKALGRDSVASLVRIALTIWWVVQWVLLGALLFAAIAYAVLLTLVANGVIEPTVLTGGQGRIGESGEFNLTWDAEGGITWPVVVPAMLIGAVVLIGGLIIVWRLRKLFESFTSGEPFRRENATHLRVIWITMVAMEIARWALFALTGLIFVSRWPDSLRAEFEPSIDLTNWMAILVLIVLAEVFREGARLKEEQELTI
jgi:hypothetical protein